MKTNIASRVTQLSNLADTANSQINILCSFKRQLRALNRTAHRCGWKVREGSAIDAITLTSEEDAGSVVKLVARRNMRGSYSVEWSIGTVRAPKGKNALKIETGSVTEFECHRIIRWSEGRLLASNNLFPSLRDYVSINK